MTAANGIATMSFVLALDSGTTSVRALVFDAAGDARAVAQREIRQFYPQPGWVEHDPLEIAAAQIDVAGEALAAAGLTARDIAAIGVTNQRETTVIWDRASGEPIAPAIVWQDRRTAERCDELRAAGLEPLIQQRTGLLLDPYFSATKVAWLLDHVPGARSAAEAGKLAFGTIDTWLLWRLTAGRLHLTDPSNASRTVLYNLATGRWDEELCGLLGVLPAMLPEIRPSSAVYGEVSGAPGLDGIPVAGIAGDQQAALFGQLCLAPRTAKCTYGTGCFLLQQTGDQPVASTQRLLTTVAWERDGARSYALEGSVFVGGAVVQWLRDGLGLVGTAEEASALAATVPDSGGVVLVPAFAGLGAPHWDPYARGVICGLTRDTTAAHLARAALEGVAFQVADVLEAMHADTGQPLAELRVDGGASRSDVLLQVQADLLGVPVVRPTQTETTALGAAYLAGLAVGLWPDVESLTGQHREERVFEPSGRAMEGARSRWRAALQRARDWERGAGDGRP